MAERNPKPKEDGAGTPAPTAKEHTAYVKAATRISSSRPLGTNAVDYDLFQRVGGSEGATRNTSARPGVLVFQYMPTLGYSKDVNSPLNRAANEAFNEIRSQISGNRNYAPSDHQIYRACVDSLRELYYLIARNYCTVKKYSATNLYRPKAIMEAQGFDFQDWFDNAADIYQWLCNMNESLLPYPTIPMGDVSKRRVELASKFYTDGDIDSTQTYVFRMSHLMSYEKVDEVKGITLKSIPSSWAGVSSLYVSALSALSQSYDVYQIASDIRRAYPDKYVNTLTLPGLTDEVTYEKMDSKLLDIMNSDILAFGAGSEVIKNNVAAAFRIYDDVGVLKCIPTLLANARKLPIAADNATGLVYAPADKSHLNALTEEMSTEDVITATRHKVIADPMINVTEGSFGMEATIFGTEILVSATMATLTSSGTIEYDKLGSMIIVYTTNRTAIESAAKIISRLSNFDWHPPVYVRYVASNAEIAQAGEALVFEDIQNYVPISRSNLRDIHTAVLYEALRA